MEYYASSLQISICLQLFLRLPRVTKSFSPLYETPYDNGIICHAGVLNYYSSVLESKFEPMLQQ